MPKVDDIFMLAMVQCIQTYHYNTQPKFDSIEATAVFQPEWGCQTNKPGSLCYLRRLLLHCLFYDALARQSNRHHHCEGYGICQDACYKSRLTSPPGSLVDVVS